MPEVRGERPFVETQRAYLVSMMVWAMSGIIVGLNIGQWLILKLAAHYWEITAVITIALVMTQMAWLTKQFLRMRKWRQELRAERESLIESFGTRIDALLPDDPIRAARMKMEMEEQWPRP